MSAMKVLVLSRNADDYRQLLAPAPGLSVEYSTSPTDLSCPVDILLAEPDYALSLIHI